MSNWAESLETLSRIPAARAHVDFLRGQIRAIEADRDRLSSERDRLLGENMELKRQLEARARAAEFQKFDGVLWKRRPDGDVDVSPYCPDCDRHPKMIPFPPFDPQLEWICPVCRLSVGSAIRPPR